MNFQHGETNTKLYHLWTSIKQRCLNPKNTIYKYYGGRGITICPEWANDYIVFRDWTLDNGYKEGLEIDRRNNDGNYEPSNCHFVTRQINGRNRKYCKINTQIANEIRYLGASGNYKQKDLAIKYSVGEMTISNIINNKSWKNL